MTKNQKDQNQQNQRGNVFFYILLAVVLIAALTYAVTRGNRGNLDVFTDQQAKLAAQEIIEYGNVVAAAVQKLRLRGCNDTEISFENDIISGYTNLNAPSDKSCHIFDLNGGNITFKRIDEKAAGLWSGTPDTNFYFMGGDEISNIGTTCGTAECADLFTIVLVKENICKHTNLLLGITDNLSNPIPIDSDILSSRFTGSYDYNTTIADESSLIDGKTAGCFYENDADPVHVFYQVLLAR